MRRVFPDLPRLTEHLTALRVEWAGRRLDSDPLVFPHRYAEAGDREVVAFLAASLAFGRVASIQASVSRVLAALGPSPSRALLDPPPLPGFVHRWIREADLVSFLRAVGEARETHGTLGSLFAAGDDGGPDFVGALDRFYEALRPRSGMLSHGLRFLLPTPGDGSACKRAHLFLRWMVRTEDVDLGLWRGTRFDTARLLLPLDTHVHRISTYLGLTSRKTADLAASREATAWLRRISPRDPVSFDWSLSRLGILAECVTERTRRHCERCAVRPVCRVAIHPRAKSPMEARTSP